MFEWGGPTILPIQCLDEYKTCAVLIASTLYSAEIKKDIMNYDMNRKVYSLD